jgi:hypothetical protein
MVQIVLQCTDVVERLPSESSAKAEAEVAAKGRRRRYF